MTIRPGKFTYTACSLMIQKSLLIVAARSRTGS
jgi:hypothetical protein